MSKKFDPIKSKNDDERSEFWDKYSKNFVAIVNARSTKSYLKGEIYLLLICRLGGMSYAKISIIIDIYR